MKKSKYCAHGEPGTDVWIEVDAENTAIAEEKHKIYANAPAFLDALKRIANLNLLTCSGLETAQEIASSALAIVEKQSL